MDYHKSPTPLGLREYGRSVQNMVEHLRTIEDIDQRTAMAHEIVRVMATIATPDREKADFHKKLWDHLYRLAGYDIQLNGPYPAPAPESERPRYERLAYHVRKSRFRQYGRNIEMMIEKALSMELGPARTHYERVIATYMKVSLLSKAGGSTVADGSLSDQVVFDHLATLSGGQIRLNANEVQLMSAQQIISRASISSASQPLYTRKKKKKVVVSGSGMSRSSSGSSSAMGLKRKKRRR